MSYTTFMFMCTLTYVTKLRTQLISRYYLLRQENETEDGES